MPLSRTYAHTQIIRFDGLGNLQENASDPGPPYAGNQISLLDFTLDPPVNTYLERSSLADPGQCYIGPVSGYFIPTATYLRDVNAVFAGVDQTINGPLTKWSFFLDGTSDSDTSVTFFFDSFGHYVRWDLWSTGLNTGVQTYYNNIQAYDTPLPASIFAGSNKCPSSCSHGDLKDAGSRSIFVL